MATDLTFNISWLPKTSEALDKSVLSIDKIIDRLDVLDKKVATPRVDLDTSQADRKIDELNRKVSGLGSINIGQGGAIGLGVLTGAGAAVAGGLLAIPAAIAAIGIAAEKDVPEVQASFANLTKTAKDTAQQGLSPLAPVLVGFANEATVALGQVKGQLYEGAQAAAPLISIIGQDFISATQKGIGASVPIVESLRPAAQALGDDLIKVEQGAAGFLGNLNVGTASQGLSQLGDDVKQILPPLGSLVSEAIPLGNALLHVVGPGITSVTSAAGALTPVVNGAASAISFLTPDVAAYTGPAAIAVGVTKLLTGSWTDFGGVISKVKPLVTDTSSVVGALGQKVGITTAAQSADNKVGLEAALVKAQLTKATAEEVAMTAAWAAEEAGTAETELAAVAAAEALTTAETELAAATAAAAEASDAASFSFGPLGIALGAVALLAAPFVLGMNKSKDSAADLSQQIIQLGQDGPAAAANLASGSPNIQKIATALGAVGSSAQQFAQEYSGSVTEAASYTDGLTSAQEKLGDTVVTVSNKVQGGGKAAGEAAESQSVSIKDLVSTVNSSKSAYEALDPTLRRQVDLYNAYNDIVPQAQDALTNMRAAQAAAQASLSQEGIVLSTTSQAWNSYGTAITKNSTDFDTATAGIKGVTDNLVASDAAFFSAQQNFAQLDAAVVQAGQGYRQAVQGVSSAQHSVAQAAQGVKDAQHSEAQAADAVVTAQQGVKQALLGVTSAEQQVAQAKRASQQAETSLMAARKAEAQQLADLTRQVASQGDSEEEARIRVLDAQTAVNEAHLQGKTIQGEGPLTTKNEADIQLLLALQEAQHNLNQVTVQGQRLAAQNTAEQKAGVNGSQQVIAAQQQVAQAQQQAAQASTGLKTAQQGVTQASKGVSQAQYAEQQAHIATQNAVYSEQQASLALRSAKDAVTTAAIAKKVAEDNDSHSTDINSAAGVRNFQTIEQLFADNKQATGDIGLATLATEDQGKKMGINKKAIDGVITSITKIPKTTAFAIVGTPSLNLSALVAQAQAEQVDPFKLGLNQHDVSLAIGDMNGHAEGGRISGPGSGTSDSIIARGDNGMLRVSNGEYIVRQKQTAKHLPLLEAINNDRLPGDGWFGGGYAGGGVVDGKSLMKVNFQLAGYDAFLQATSNILHAFGRNTPSLPKPGTADLGSLGGGGISMFGSDLGLRGSRAANEQIVKNVWASMFGWTGQEWAATVPLLMQESGFNNVAQNPTSTAYGMFQFLDSTWGGYGIPKTSDPRLQAIAGGRYIGARYHDPIGALAHEHAYNWYRDGGPVALKPPKSYDNGGPLMPGLSLVHNGTGRVENVRTGEAEDALLAELRGLRQDLKNYPSVTVNGGPQHSVDQLVTDVMRRLTFNGRG